MSNKSKLYTWIGAAVFLLIIVILGYSMGLRFGGRYLIGRVASVRIEVPQSNTFIIVDESSKVTTTEKDNQHVEMTLSPGMHSIIISHDLYYPWIKTLPLESGEKMILHPFLVSQNPSGLMIGQKDPEYWSLRSSIEKSVMPTKSNPLTSADGETKVWLENNTILSTVAGTLHTVITPETPVKNISFFKDRSDVIIFATGTGVFAIEVDPANTQNFMPIYTGTDPHFIESDLQSIYVLDGAILMQVSI